MFLDVPSLAAGIRVLIDPCRMGNGHRFHGVPNLFLHPFDPVSGPKRRPVSRRCRRIRGCIWDLFRKTGSHRERPSTRLVKFIYDLLRQTHWARNRPRDVFERAIKHSLCFGAYEGKRQVGFARVVTDHATFGYLMDVIIDPAWRGRGIGLSLLTCVMKDPVVSSLRIMLLRTETAHGLYQKAGFALAPNAQDLMALYQDDLTGYCTRAISSAA